MLNNDDCIYTSEHGELYLGHLYTVELSTTFSATVKSYGFSGAHNFCMLRDDIQEQIDNLTAMSNSLSGTCKITDCESYSYIRLQFEGKELKITGKLGMFNDDNSLKFGFFADQTVLKLLANVLTGFIAR